MLTCWFKKILSATPLRNPDYSGRSDETETYEYFLMTHCRGQFCRIHRLKEDIYFFFHAVSRLDFPRNATVGKQNVKTTIWHWENSYIYYVGA